jgi:hypothetical protein
MRTFLTTVTLIVVISIGAFPAWAYFTSRGAGAATAVAASVPRPTGVSAVQTAEGTVKVDWTSASSALSVVDEVRRWSGSSSTVVCTGSGVRTCTDTSVPAGTHTYTVTGRTLTWSSTSTPSSPLTVIDNVPAVSSFVRNDPPATNLASVSWTLIFSEPVTGLSTANLALVASGVSGATVTAVNGSGRTWTVTASTGSNSGTLALRLANAAGVTDSTGNAPTVPVTGESYAIRPFFPSSLTLTNGGTNNRIDTGDTITVGFSLAPAHASLCGAWTDAGAHTSTAVVATVVDGGRGNDSMTFGLATCPALRLGSVALGSPGYVAGGSATFTATLTVADGSSTVTILLGTRTGTGTLATVGSAPSATFVSDPSLRSTSDVAALGSVGSTGRF